MKRLILMALALILITGCSQSIEQIKSEDYVGEQVTVKGEVKKSLKIGDVSGFRLEDDKNNSIKVGSEKLPQEGNTVTVTGVLMDDSLMGYYIQAEKIS
ncbi:MAG: hypothetical protein ACOCQX_01710 [Candidatus Nanoarchaeia archaeon]